MTYNSKDVYTFSNASRGCYSVIDYICVSTSMRPFVVNYDTLNSAYNFSDHEPVEIILNRPGPTCTSPLASNDNTNNVNCNKSTSRPSRDDHVGRRFRFDHCNVQ